MEPDPTLIVVPVRAETAEEIEPILQTLVSVATTAPTTMVLAVDDRSPEPEAQLIQAACEELQCAYVLQEDGEGVAAAINVGLAAANEHGMDACVVASGVMLEDHGWLERLQARTDKAGELAAVAGGSILEADGTIRHAGYFFSLFRRSWSARLRYVPQELLEVEEPLLCPVSVELALIRRPWIERIGMLDPVMDAPHASLDYCLRVHAEGGQSILEPTVHARALEKADPEPNAHAPAASRLRLKHADVNFGRWCPEVIS